MIDFSIQYLKKELNPNIKFCVGYVQKMKVMNNIFINLF